MKTFFIIWKVFSIKFPDKYFLFFLYCFWIAILFFQNTLQMWQKSSLIMPSSLEGISKYIKLLGDFLFSFFRFDFFHSNLLVSFDAATKLWKQTLFWTVSYFWFFVSLVHGWFCWYWILNPCACYVIIVVICIVCRITNAVLDLHFRERNRLQYVLRIFILI